MLELGWFCFSRSIRGKPPNLLTQPKLRWLLYNYLNCYTAKDRLILHRSSPSVPLFWLPVACGIHGHGCNDPRQRPLFGLRQPAYKPCGSPLATAHTLVQYEEDVKPSPTCFPAPSSPQGPPSLQNWCTVSWSAGKPLAFYFFPLSGTIFTWIIQLRQVLPYYWFQLQTWKGRGTHFICVAGEQLEHAREGSHGASVCPRKPKGLERQTTFPSRALCACSPMPWCPIAPEVPG